MKFQKKLTFILGYNKVRTQHFRHYDTNCKSNMIVPKSQKKERKKERKKTTTTATSQKIDVYKQATIKSEMLGFTKSVVPIRIKILDHEDKSNQQLLLKLHRINYLFNRLHG